MLSEELLAQVRTLDDADKLALLQTLIDDLAVTEHGYEIFGFRGNYAIEQKMLKILEEQKVQSQSNVE